MLDKSDYGMTVKHNTHMLFVQRLQTFCHAFPFFYFFVWTFLHLCPRLHANRCRRWTVCLAAVYVAVDSQSIIMTRSTGTVRTSAKARLSSVAIRIQIRIQIRIRIPDSDRYQNLIVCSLTRCQPSLKISCKSVRKFLRKVANKQTGKQTDKQRRKHNLLGGSNKYASSQNVVFLHNIVNFKKIMNSSRFVYLIV